MSSNPYDHLFFEGHLAGAKESARQVVPIVLDYLHVSSVIDVGCGVGAWLSVFAEHGISDYLGIDGDYVDRSQLVIPADRFVPADLKQRVVVDRRFDLVVSLEVAEHLPAECAESFVGSLVGLGDVVLFSASIPHQEGVNHINEQWPDYWAGLFERHNYVTFDILRRQLWRNERVSWWYSQNILLFVRREVVDQYPALTAASDVHDAVPLSYVHPQIFLHKEWRISQLTAQKCELEAQIASLEQRIEKLRSPKYLIARLPVHIERQMRKLLRLP